MSDKNETATAENSSAVGNGAKMREALVKVKEWMEHRIATCGFEASATFPTMLEDVVLPALAEPPRNCDRFNSGNAERDAEMAWDAITSGMDLQFSDLTDREIAIIKESMRGFVWLFSLMDNTKGDAK